jgi:hypothetical protein
MLSFFQPDKDSSVHLQVLSKNINWLIIAYFTLSKVIKVNSYRANSYSENGCIP